ncbi:MAG: HlyC/CorC family transporter [Robiginitomaculum sp.]|nr:HlyC/CorC family transporter [Robiginitomaculum sp.]
MSKQEKKRNTKDSWWKTLFPSRDKNQTSSPKLDEAAQELVDNALAFDHLRIEDIMVPRADIKAVGIETNLEDLSKEFISASHSRLPVYRGNLDDPVGMVHIKDLLPALMAQLKNPENKDVPNVEAITRDVLFVPPSMNADDLLVRMQKTRVHMALVVDEYGGTDGLVTLEDLIEQIVGNIEDEHDSDIIMLRSTAPAVWDASARVSIDELEAATGVSLRNNNDEDDVETLGGLVFTLVGRVPSAGEVLLHPAGFEFEITKADPRRILALTIRKIDHDQAKTVS